ncbi:uncharacterized protein LOC125178584 [Hyalella azteca]|uniref:inositol-pentakisphosphate 2-kinase n=1 Tax=Hyalella azteca TaxID=294128 RepID=A0A979FNN6_HYAAZ|nr:uncharacterized protein LOC125178584 [Hyalella azteca]
MPSYGKHMPCAVEDCDHHVDEDKLQFQLLGEGNDNCVVSIIGTGMVIRLKKVAVDKTRALPHGSCSAGCKANSSQRSNVFNKCNESKSSALKCSYGKLPATYSSVHRCVKRIDLCGDKSVPSCPQCCLIRQCCRDLAFLNHIAFSFFGPSLVKPGRLVRLSLNTMQSIEKQLQHTREEGRLHKTINPYGIAILCPDASTTFHGCHSVSSAVQLCSVHKNICHDTKTSLPIHVTPEYYSYIHEENHPSQCQNCRRKHNPAYSPSNCKCSKFFKNTSISLEKKLESLDSDSIMANISSSVPLHKVFPINNLHLLTDEEIRAKKVVEKLKVQKFLAQLYVDDKINAHGPKCIPLSLDPCYLNHKESQLKPFPNIGYEDELSTSLPITSNLGLHKAQVVGNSSIRKLTLENTIGFASNICQREKKFCNSKHFKEDSFQENPDSHPQRSNDRKKIPSDNKQIVGDLNYSQANPKIREARKPVTLCVELKPKQGFLEPVDDESMLLCRFCLKQFIKCSRGEPQPHSNYCPLEFFSGDVKRMAAAVQQLFAAPQNNLRIFKDGVVVEDLSQYSFLSFKYAFLPLFDITSFFFESHPFQRQCFQCLVNVIQCQVKSLEGTSNSPKNASVDEDSGNSSDGISEDEVYRSQQSELCVVKAFEALERLIAMVGEDQAYELLRVVPDGAGNDVCQVIEEDGCTSLQKSQSVSDDASFPELLPISEVISECDELVSSPHFDPIPNALQSPFVERENGLKKLLMDDSSSAMRHEAGILVSQVQEFLKGLTFKDCSLMILLSGWYLCQVTVIDLVSKDPSKVKLHYSAVRELQQLVLRKQQLDEPLPKCCLLP